MLLEQLEMGLYYYYGQTCTANLHSNCQGFYFWLYVLITLPMETMRNAALHKLSYHNIVHWLVYFYPLRDRVFWE